MIFDTVKIPLKITQQILEHAQRFPEAEVCGLIGAENNNALSCYPITNTHQYPETRFSLDSKEHIAAFKTMREQNETLFAIYHSHPHSAAEPSVIDIQLANYPEALYLIISLNTKGVLELRGFKINQQQSQEVSLILCSE